MFGVQPEMLREASKRFHDSAELLFMVKLDADALGQVPAAEFVDALARHPCAQSTVVAGQGL